MRVVRAAISVVFAALMMALAPAFEASAQDKLKIEVVPQIGHSQPVDSVAFSPDGMRILSGGVDATLKLWDASSGTLLRTFAGHSIGVCSVAFSPDGARALSGGSDKTLKLWDVATGNALRTFEGHAGTVTSVAFSRDGTHVLSASQDKTLKLWDTATGALLRTFEGHSDGVRSVAFSPDGMRVMSGSSDMTLKLWNSTTGALLRTFEGHSNTVRAVAFSPDGSRLLSGSGDIWGSDSKDATLRLWDPATGTLLRTFVGHAGAIDSVAFSPDGTRMLSGGRDMTIKLWDPSTGTLLHTFAGHSDQVHSVAFSPDGTRVLSGSWDTTLKLWDPATGALLRTFAGPSLGVNAVAISPNGARVLSGSVSDNSLKVWDAATGAMVRAFAGHSGFHSIAFSPDGKLVLSSSPLQVRDAITGVPLRSFDGHSSWVRSAAFSPDGGRLLSGSDDTTLKLWETATGALLRTIRGHSKAVNSVAFSPDGARILSGSTDKTLKLWDTVSGALLHTLEGHSDGVSSVAFSPDGARVLSGGADKTLRLWDSATGGLLRTFDGHSTWVSSVTFSPDGARVLSGSGDTTLKLWDAATGALLSTFQGHSSSVSAVAFLSDGRRVVSGSMDSTTRIWDVATGQQLASLIEGNHGEWLSMTPAGFFDASDGGLDMLSVVRGLEVFSVDQFRDQLQRKDLLQELLSGDVLRKHEDEASKLNLQKILDSGPTPTLELLDNEIERAGDTVRLKVRIFNNEGGGIGKRLIWRVNGQTAGETEPAALQSLANPNGPVVVTQALKLDPSQENMVTVTAYNGAGLLATLPLRYKIDAFGATPVGEARPRMFILAVGVDSYSEPALTPLKLAVKDVSTLARDLKASAEAGGYEKAEIIERLEGNATKDKIAAAFADIAARVKRQDALIVLLAGHGKSVSGRYYYVPVSARFGGVERRDITSEGIATDAWERWIASIQVNKKLLIIDTCESSDFIPRGSKDELARETAVDYLRRSLGNSVITAARQAAYEGSRLGHGILTYAVLEALAKPTTVGKFIDVEAIHQHVRIAVPRLSAELSGQVQEPFNRIVGNFPIGATLPNGPKPPTQIAVQPGRYILFGTAAVPVRSKPEETADINVTLEVPTEVQVFEFVGSWTLIGRNDTKLGYVPASAITRLK